MFGPDPELPGSLPDDSAQPPGRAAFHAPADSIRECQQFGAARTTAEPFALAIAMWSLEPGVGVPADKPDPLPWPR